MSFLDHIKRCNNADLSQFEPWFIGSQRAGFLHRDFAPVVAAQTDLFRRRDKAWHLDPALDTPHKRTGAVGARFRMASKITADVLPVKGWRPVDISYKTAPKENRSVRVSSSSPRACSGDM